LERFEAEVRQKQTVFFALQIAGGHIGLPLLALVSLSRKVHRDPAFFNFCLTWVVSSVVFCVLYVIQFFFELLTDLAFSLYRGTEGHTFNAPYGGTIYGPSVQFSRRCFVQASLIAGVQAMTSCSTAALVIQVGNDAYHSPIADMSYVPKLWLKLRTAIYGVTLSPVQPRLITFAVGFHLDIQIRHITRPLV
jgi:hypothetical protein